MTTTHTIGVEAERVLFGSAFPMSSLFAESRPGDDRLREKMEFAFQAWLAAKRSIQPTIAAEDVRDAAQCLIDVLDGYPAQLVPINRESATVKALRKAIATPTPPSKG